ncbi:MAG: hypothetical protein MK358_10305, partial [Vicinamibacterales bacterium]|nr:hypothetical protein [Vicinamibacterales bacterium]
WQVRRAPDTGDNEKIVWLNLQIGTRLEQCGKDAKVPTARTPVRRYLGFIILRYEYRACHF